MVAHKIAALLAAAALLPAKPAAAQLVQIEPKIGAFAPLSSLGFWNGDLRSLQGSFAIGLAAEVKPPVLPRIRVGFDYATTNKISAQNGVGGPGSAGPSLLALTGDFVFSPSEGRVRPYALIGAGIKRYNYSVSKVSDITTRGILDANQSDFTGHLGVGVDVGVGASGLRLELSDYVSHFDVNGTSRLQHDLFVMLGLRVDLL
jgi:hypothetical protein